MGLSVEMFASDWLFCLFCSAIPLSALTHFFTAFLKDGWLFFYRLAMAILGILKPRILREDDSSLVLNLLKLNKAESELPEVGGGGGERFMSYLTSWIPRGKGRREELLEETGSEEFWAMAFERAHASAVTQAQVERLRRAAALLDEELEEEFEDGVSDESRKKAGASSSSL